ncbi:MAG TPA: COX15/CtaA family protein [Planctomycetota bacterium]
MAQALGLTRSTPLAGTGGPATSWRGLRWAALLCVVVAFLPITLGAIVTSLDVGMAVPDWPTTFEQNMFTYPFSEMTESTGVFFEHSHRLAGALIGFASIALVAAAVASRGVPRALRAFAVLALLGVCVQGLLGGLRVLENERIIAMVHGIGAQAVLALFVVVLKLSSQAWSAPARPANAPRAARLRLWSGVAVAVLFVHLFAGAGLRHQQASLSGHLVLAGVVTVVLLAVVRMALLHFADRKAVAGAARALVTLLGVQLGLGLGSWAFKHGPAAAGTSIELHAAVSAAHVVVGAAVMAVVVGLAMEARYRLPAADAGAALAGPPPSGAGA